MTFARSRRSLAPRKFVDESSCTSDSYEEDYSNEDPDYKISLRGSRKLSSAKKRKHSDSSCSQSSCSGTDEIGEPILTRQTDRQRMRPWLIDQVDRGDISGLEWLDDDKTLMKLPWKHGSRHGWTVNGDACLFQRWAVHTGKYRPYHPVEKQAKNWKANFRCAINSLLDVEEVYDRGQKGQNAYKVYKLLDKRKPKRATKVLNTGDKTQLDRRTHSCKTVRRKFTEKTDKKPSIDLLLHPPSDLVACQTTDHSYANPLIDDVAANEDVKDITSYSISGKDSVPDSVLDFAVTDTEGLDLQSQTDGLALSADYLDLQSLLDLTDGQSTVDYFSPLSGSELDGTGALPPIASIMNPTNLQRHSLSLEPFYDAIEEDFQDERIRVDINLSWGCFPKESIYSNSRPMILTDLANLEMS